MRVVAVTGCHDCPFGETVLGKKIEPMKVYCQLQDYKLVDQAGSGGCLGKLDEACPLPTPERWIETYKWNKDKGCEVAFEEEVARIRFAVMFGPSWCLKEGDYEKALPGLPREARKEDA